jgi:alkylated DNA repair dioxygenase AlkB
VHCKAATAEAKQTVSGPTETAVEEQKSAVCSPATPFTVGASVENKASLPEGFRYPPELIGPADEGALFARVSALSFREFEFHGHTGRRRVVSFGWHYDFSARHLRKADDIPDYLIALLAAAPGFADMEPEELQHVLATEYGPGAGIGWHLDKAVFGRVVGVSLLSPCVALQEGGRREEVGACERGGRASLGLPPERPGAV